MSYRTVLAVLAMMGWSVLAWAAEPATGIPTKPILPDGLGVNIHFTSPQPGEMKMLAEGGFRWIRMDFSWGATEREKGKYNFTAYDHLLASLKPHGIRSLFILDYANRLYDDGVSPHTDTGRKAFARWAAAAAKHFAGQGILWEMYNEPNIGFWKPKPQVEDYVKLALDVGKALRTAAPDETYIGPATSRIDLPFLEACFQAGLLEYWSAVSVHPYRQKGPETAAAEYAKLRQMIDKYAPAKERIPIISGEWGYSSTWAHMNPALQGRMLPRQWLTNLANEIPVSIWYDWHEDGRDPKEPEHHFGTVAHTYYKNRDPVYDPKPAYLAAKTLATTLAGYTYNKRLDVGNEQTYVLLFAHGDDIRLAAWSTAEQPIEVTIPANPGKFSVVGHTGEQLAPVTADAKGLTLNLTGAPVFLNPSAPNELLRVAAACSRVPPQLVTAATGELNWPIDVRNPLTKTIRVRAEGGHWVTLPTGHHTRFLKKIAIRRADNQRRVTSTCVIEKMGTIVQTTRITASNPLSVRVTPAIGGALQVEIENQSGDSFAGKAKLVKTDGIRIPHPQVPVTIKPGETRKKLSFACTVEGKRKYTVGVQLTDTTGTLQSETRVQTFSPLSCFDGLTPESVKTAMRLTADGDPKVTSEQSLSVAVPPDGPPAPHIAAMKITYQFGVGWKFIRLAPMGADRQVIVGHPAAFGLWLYGDESGNHFRVRVTDATGQTFQPSGPTITWHGWRYIEVPLSGQKSGHWGGAEDGKMHYPIRWDSIALLDSARREKCAGTIYLSQPVLVYQDDNDTAQK